MNVLSIYDAKDELSGSCKKLADAFRDKRLKCFKEIILHVGTGHGILYRPLSEWLDPLTAWANDPGK